MAWDITKQVVAGVIVAAITAAGSMIYAKIYPEAPKEGFQKIVYVLGTRINESVGITSPVTVPAAPSSEIAPAPQPVPAPTATPAPATITQDTPFQSENIYASDFKATRKGSEILFSFSVRNTSQQSILIALDHADGISVSAESGKDATGSATGIRSVYHGEEQERYYTELGPDSIIYVTASLTSSKLPDAKANFNVTLLQRFEGKSKRYTFGRPVAIAVKNQV